jgi:hypothetical protein
VKKRLKKLVLAKETMRNLEEPVLGDVAGGVTSPPAQCITWWCASTNGPFECAAICD